jgi:hypothetical protein
MPISAYGMPSNARLIFSYTARNLPCTASLSSDCEIDTIKYSEKFKVVMFDARGS